MKTQLKKDEKIILLTKPHWFWLATPFLITIAGFILGIIIEKNTKGIYGLLLILIVICYFIFKIIQRNMNIWVVTNLRVIDEHGVISNNSKESPLDKINNVTYKQSFWGKIFGFGNVQIQTAAEIGSTTYFAVEKPKELKDTITQMQEEYKESQIKKQAAELASAIAAGEKNKTIDVAAELEKLYELKQKGILTEEEYSAGKKKILNS
jgi:uncharacterized membrane protein YdbT with pleckstrin-like domain